MSVKQTPTTFIGQMAALREELYSSDPPTSKQMNVFIAAAQIVQAWDNGNYVFVVEREEITPMPSMPYGGYCSAIKSDGIPCKATIAPRSSGYLAAPRIPGGKQILLCPRCGNKIAVEKGYKAFYAEIEDSEPLPM